MSKLVSLLLGSVSMLHYLPGYQQILLRDKPKTTDVAEATSMSKCDHNTQYAATWTCNFPESSPHVLKSGNPEMNTVHTCC